jgi:hypothetical protein
MLAATLLIGVIAGVAIVQLFPDSGTRDEGAVSPVEPVIVVAAPTSETNPARDGEPADDVNKTRAVAAIADTAAGADRTEAAGGGEDLDGGVAFVTREELESELPPAVVDLLIEYSAILVEEVPTDVP